MNNLNIPKEIINNIKTFIPRDRDMKHPTSELIDLQICIFKYNLEKRPDFYNWLYPKGMSFIEFTQFCRTTGYPEKRAFREVYLTF